MKKTILIIEDNSIDMDILYEYTKDDYNILKASTGEEGLSIIENNSIILSAILLDLVMPKMTGFDVLRKIKDNPVLQHIPVIITTCLDDEKSFNETLKLGAISYILKPYDKSVVLMTLTNIINLSSESALSIRSYVDKVTGLLNRDAFISEAECLIRNHESNYYMISYMNIEKFKIINEQKGTECGDKVLQHVGECLTELTVALNGIAARDSSDHFVMLLPAKYSESDIVKGFQKKVSRIDFLKNPITLRIGRYFINQPSIPISIMCDKAMMAESTIIGKYGIYVAVYTDKMDETLIEEQSVINRMEEALKNKEFEAWYQPQYNHATHSLIGAEALVRWRDSKTGQLIPPYKFISIFEKNGFIYELDKFVWEEVCVQLNKWHKLSMEKGSKKAALPVSVNISRMDIFHDDFFDVITGLVEKYDIPKELLRLEVTESAFSEATSDIIAKVKSLLEYGFTVEIDDFGSGYSSLNTLKDVPAQILKLDMKFFEDTGNIERGGNIVESIVRMAKWIGMAVIAEGVENKAQADFLKTIGCYYIQGYFYAKPMPLEDYEELLEKENSEPRLDRLITVKELDNSKFWDPKSMEALIFNSYVGGACIFEYRNGITELIRANDRYLKIFNNLVTVGSSLKDYAIMNFLTTEEKSSLLKRIEKCIETKTEISEEVKLGNDTTKRVYVRMTLRVIAIAGDRYLFYSVLEDITEQKTAQLEKEELKRKEQEIALQTQAIINSSPCGITAVILKDNKVPEFVFTNNMYCELLGYTREQFNNEIKDAFSLIDSEDLKWLEPKIKELKEVGQLLNVEMRAIKRDRSRLWLKGVISVVKLESIVEPVQVSTFYDITTEKNNEANLKFLNESSHDILKISDCGIAIKKTLEKLVTFLDTERAYVIELDTVTQEMKQVIEVCAEGISPRTEEVHKTSVDDLRLFHDMIGNEKILYIEDTKKITNQSLSKRLDTLGIKAFALALLWQQGKLSGYAIVENPKKSVAHKDSLIPMCDYISILLTRLNTQNIEQKVLPITLSQIMKNSTDMMFVKDTNLQYVAASPSAYTLAGCSSEEEMIGKTDAELFHSNLSQKYSTDDRRVLEKGQVVINDHDIIVTKDGNAHSVISSKFPLLDSCKNVIGLYGISRDMTQYRDNEVALKLLTDSIPGGIISFDCKEGSFESVYINEKLFVISGFTSEEYNKLAVDNPIFFIHEEDRHFIKDYINKHFEKVSVDDILRCDCRCANKDGGYKVFSFVGSVEYYTNNHFKFNVVLVKRT